MQQQKQLNPQINREQIVKTFQKYGYMPNAMINRTQMNQILKTEYTQKKGTNMSPQLLDQIWNESEATSKGQIAIGTIADIILQAQRILSDRINKLSGSNGMISQLRRGIQEKHGEVREQMDYFNEDRMKSKDYTKELISMQAQLKQNEHDLQNFTSDYQTINKIFSDGKNINSYPFSQPVQTKYITGQSFEGPAQQNFTMNNPSPNPQQQIIYQPPFVHPMQPDGFQNIPNKSQAAGMAYLGNTSQVEASPSGKLKIIFYVTCILIVLEMLLMSSLRISMLPLTAYLHSLYTLVVGLAASNSILFLLAHLLVSVAGDITFVVLKLIDRELLMPFSHTSNSVYTLILFAILIITIILRIALIILFVPFRNAYQNSYNDSFNFLGSEFMLRPASLNKQLHKSSLPLQPSPYSQVQPYSPVPAQLNPVLQNKPLVEQNHMQGEQLHFQQKPLMMPNQVNNMGNDKKQWYLN